MKNERIMRFDRCSLLRSLRFMLCVTLRRSDTRQDDRKFIDGECQKTRYLVTPILQGELLSIIDRIVPDWWLRGDR
jgi:hypothetical protein